MSHGAVDGFAGGDVWIVHDFDRNPRDTSQTQRGKCGENCISRRIRRAQLCRHERGRMRKDRKPLCFSKRFQPISTPPTPESKTPTHSRARHRWPQRFGVRWVRSRRQRHGRFSKNSPYRAGDALRCRACGSLPTEALKIVEVTKPIRLCIR